MADKTLLIWILGVVILIVSAVLLLYNQRIGFFTGGVAVGVLGWGYGRYRKEQKEYGNKK